MSNNSHELVSTGGESSSENNAGQMIDIHAFWEKFGDDTQALPAGAERFESKPSLSFRQGPNGAYCFEMTTRGIRIPTVATPEDLGFAPDVIVGDKLIPLSMPGILIVQATGSKNPELQESESLEIRFKSDDTSGDTSTVDASLEWLVHVGDKAQQTFSQDYKPKVPFDFDHPHASQPVANFIRIMQSDEVERVILDGRTSIEENGVLVTSTTNGILEDTDISKADSAEMTRRAKVFEAWAMGVIAGTDQVETIHSAEQGSVSPWKRIVRFVLGQ